jgi:hypothetical protein
MAHDVFISHSVKDKATAHAVCAMLESNGIRCWIAPRDVLPSMDWSEAIIDAIEQCRIMVLVFTANANASPQIRREVERAVNHGVAILPVRMEDVLPGKSLEYFIGNVHWLDALTPPVEAHLKSLAGTIKILLARTEPGAPATLPQEEKPQATGGFGATKRAPAIADAHEKSPAPRHFWSTRSWTWAGGAVAAFLLVAIFIGVHFNSGAGPAGSPSQSNPGGAAPEPAPAAEPATSIPDGPGETPPAASPAPVPPPRQGASKSEKPNGVSRAVAPASPPEQTAPPQAAPPPAQGVDNATLLRDTMKTFQDELNSVGKITFVYITRNESNGSNSQVASVWEVSNVVADPAQCRVWYHFRQWDNGAAQPTQDADFWFLLSDETGVVVEPVSRYLTGVFAAAGNSNVVVTSANPPIESVSVVRNKSYAEFPFTDAGSANRFADTARKAGELCGSHLAN